jgi:hypothetical protein
MLDRDSFIREASVSFTEPGQRLAGATTCLEEYFQSMPKDRISNVEAGTRDHQLIGPHQPKDQPIGIIFRENRQPIGAMKFEFFSGSNSFKINSVVDASCQPVEDYRNATRSGDKRLLQIGMICKSDSAMLSTARALSMAKARSIRTLYE